MDIPRFLVVNFLNGLIAVFLYIAGIKIFGILGWNFYEELKENSIATAIVIASFFLGLAAILCTSAF